MDQHLLPNRAPARWPGQAFPILMLLSLGSRHLELHHSLGPEALGTANTACARTPPCPCSGGPLPNTFPPVPQVKSHKPSGTQLQHHLSSAALPCMAPSPPGGAKCLLFCALCYQSSYKLTRDMFAYVCPLWGGQFPEGLDVFY